MAELIAIAVQEVGFLSFAWFFVWSSGVHTGFKHMPHCVAVWRHQQR